MHACGCAASAGCDRLGCRFMCRCGARQGLCARAQGMADLDPDVDAIYRLTQNLGVNFEADIASVVLPEGVMCPWNSQNTLFEREALWGMLIPVTTTFRVCDIWRSYWVQVRGSCRPVLLVTRHRMTLHALQCGVARPQ